MVSLGEANLNVVYKNRLKLTSNLNEILLSLRNLLKF